MLLSQLGPVGFALNGADELVALLKYILVIMLMISHDTYTTTMIMLMMSHDTEMISPGDNKTMVTVITRFQFSN
jgi:hypothetical protein